MSPVIDCCKLHPRQWTVYQEWHSITVRKFTPAIRSAKRYGGQSLLDVMPATERGIRKPQHGY